MPGEPAGRSGTSGEATGALRHPFRSALAVMVVAVLGLLATAAFKSYRDLDSAKSYERELLDEIAGAKERIQTLDGRIDRIRNDPMMLERLAREDLGMVYEGDVVIVLPDSRWAHNGSSAPLRGDSTRGQVGPSGSVRRDPVGRDPRSPAGMTSP